MPDNFPHKELTYKIRGILFQVQNDLGTKFQEKHYQKAVAAQLKLNKLEFKKEAPALIDYYGQTLGNFRIDFMIENTVGLELKTTDRLTSEHRQQALRYIEALRIPIILIANFRIRPLQIIRVVNSNYLRNQRPKASAK